MKISVALFLILILLISNVSAQSPEIEPPTGKIVFASWEDTPDFRRDLFIMNADGSDLTQLTTEPDDHYVPMFSPDGTKIAYVAGLANGRGNQVDLYVMNADGSHPVNLTNYPRMYYRPVWSPDGTRLVFRSDLCNRGDIFILNIDGTNLTRLTDHPAVDSYPDWSPDGETIVFASERDGTYELYTVSVDGEKLTRLTDNNVVDNDADFSPDGTRLAYVSSPQTGGADIFVLTLATGEITQLTATEIPMELDPQWSPDGNYITFMSDAAGNFEIYTMRADGSEVTRLTNRPEMEGYVSWGVDPEMTDNSAAEAPTPPGITDEDIDAVCS